MQGTVKSFNPRKGYGFIAGDDGVDMFVHYTGIKKDGFKSLEAGERVEYEVGTDQRGKTIAQNVCVIG